MPSSFSERSKSGYPVGSLTRNPSAPRTLLNTVMIGVAIACGVIALVPLIAVLSYVIIQGFSSLRPSIFFELPPIPSSLPSAPVGGFGNAIIGTMLMVGLGTLISVPVGVLAAIYLTEFSSGKLSQWIRFATNVLSGIPSIIAGVFAYGVAVASPWFGFLFTGKFQPLGYSAIAGGVALAILMLPIIIRTTDEALQLVTDDLRQAAVGIGATNFQTVMSVVVPAALPAIVTGTTLAVARASGETAPLIFTALFSTFWPRDLTQPTASLAVLVYNFATTTFENQKSLAWAASLILVLMVLITSIIARLATNRKTY
jgi:phosphate transport system permease protein